MTELTSLERTLLEALARGPRSPARIGLEGGTSAVARALAHLEDLGATRMAGSSDAGPWVLTLKGHTLLWDEREPGSRQQ